LSADLARREAELERALKRAREERVQLQRELAEAQAKAEQIEENDVDATRRVSELEQQLTASSTNEAQAQTELAKLKEAHSTDQVALASQEQAIRDLNAKLERQSAAIDREKQLLSAGREIRDVIAARNLHIIDVYDTDGEGKTKKAFGRAFYTEGKSLVFYAYDLPAHRTENAKYAFYAWGKSDGSDHAIRSLGLMYSDDQAQKRWVLKVTDPEVLSQIDSVFITLERTDNPGNRPRGKELLSAYLHSPANHP
jgi:chemotaxis protein histidine kinase CheA